MVAFRRDHQYQYPTASARAAAFNSPWPCRAAERKARSPWGVLDRLLEEPDLDIVRVSGTSAGALNGAALVTGLARRGREGAKENLALLWQKVAQAGSLLTFLLMPLRKPGMGIWDDALPVLSPTRRIRWEWRRFGMS